MAGGVISPPLVICIPDNKAVGPRPLAGAGTNEPVKRIWPGERSCQSQAKSICNVAGTEWPLAAAISKLNCAERIPGFVIAAGDKAAEADDQLDHCPKTSTPATR